MIYRALYSMIQFSSVTLLYSFASSLGDFQFLYIDLFIIIPIAVTSEFLVLWLLTCAEWSSGTDVAFSQDSPQETDGEPCVEEGAGEHYRTDCDYHWIPGVGILLGATTAMVSVYGYVI